MINIGLTEHYLDIKVSQLPNKITLTQSAFTIEILERFDMKDSKPVLTPMEARAQLDLEVASEFLSEEEKK